MKTYFIFSLAMIAVFFSCKKNDKISWGIPKVKTLRFNGSTGEDKYFYDKEGRCIKAESNTNRIEYTYSTGSVKLKGTDLTNGAVYEQVDELNAAGLVVKSNNTTFAYTPNGYLLSATSLNPPSPVRFTLYHYNSGTGLLDSLTRLTGNKWEETIVYTYYLDKTETTDGENRGFMYKGKSRLHPPKRVLYIRPKVTPPYREQAAYIDYTYGYDEAGRIVLVSQSSDVFSTEDAIYTYY